MTNRPNGYWKKEENVIAEAKQAMEKHGWDTLPQHGQLSLFGYSSLGAAITNYHGGIQGFRTKLGQQNPQKPPGYWQKLENVLVEATKAMEEQKWDTIPSAKKLTKHGYTSLRTAINKYHGGFITFRTTLGQTNTKKPQKYWQKEENAIAEAQQAMKKHEWGTLPPANKLTKHGYSSLACAISKYHGGLRTFRTTLGQTNTRKPPGYWQLLDNTLTEARKLIELKGWDTLPPADIIRALGYSSFYVAINKYHGGINHFRKLLTEQETGKTQKQQLEELLDEYIAA